jgi:uncharacterized protein
MIRFNGVEGRRKMRNNDHETRFCGSIGSGGLRRRSYSRLCPRGWWAWRRVCEPWRLRAQSYHSLGITSTADARFPKSDSGPTRSRAAAWAATLASPHLVPILLLVGSNLFMTFAWYGHLRFKEVPLVRVIVASWLIAFVEYCMAVPANRWGSAVYTTAQLKTIQEVITLLVFAP